MADVNANIGVNIDTSAALANLKNLQRQISAFHTQMAKSGASAAASSAAMQQNLVNTINQTGKFNASIKTIKTTTESFTNSLERNKFSMGEYFRYSAASTKTFGRFFRSEFDTINKVARERVKTLQTQYVKLGRDAGGAMKAIAVRPVALDMKNLGTQTQIAAQRQALFNQLVRQGSTNLLNFGKNTQWAGRQLMVGFTVPLTMLGVVAGKTFMQIEEQAIRFKKVYGEMFTTDAETAKALEQIKELANEFTKYGVAVEKTIQMAADAAQAGFMGRALEAQVVQATRLAVLGGMEQEKSLETTIALQNAFRISTENLADSINFLNSVENQTVLGLDDITEAIPRVGPIITELGGDIKDLAFFLTAMKEGGVSAAQGANALKSGLGRLINPTKAASDYLAEFGINLTGIVESNFGDLRGTVVAFAQALEPLGDLERSRAVEKVFGKFQFARILALLNNITRSGTQASRVLELTAASAEELAILSERELKQVEDSTTFRFKKSMEGLKAAIAPVGEEFLKAITPLVEFASKILKEFDKMGDGTKSFITNIVGIAGVIGPLFLMTFGLIANGFANLIKMFAFLGRAFSGIKGSTTEIGLSTQYMTQEQLEAAAVAASLNQAHSKLIQTFTSEAGAVNALTQAYQRATVAQAGFAGGAVGRARPPRGGLKLASGIVSVPGPKGAGDVVPAMLSPGEAVIPAKFAKQYAPLISGMVSGNIPGFRFGFDPFKSMLGRSRVAVRMKSDDFSQALMAKGKNARYKSAFETQTGADYKNPKQALARSAMERDILGLDPKTTAAGARPTYGYARTSPLQAIFNSLFGLKGKQFNQVTARPSKSLDLYGDLDLITKSSIAKRSSVGMGDSLLNYVRGRESISRRPNYNYPVGMQLPMAPMRGASKDQLRSFGTSFGTPFGERKLPGTNQYTLNAKPAYLETQTPGGFFFKDIDRVIASSPAMAKQLRAELNAAGLGGIRVTGSGFAARLFKKLGIPGYNKGIVSVDEFDPKTLKFAGKSFTRQNANKAQALKNTIEMLQSKGIPDDKILARVDELASRADRNELKPSKLVKNFNYTVGGQPTSRGGGASSAPANVTALTGKIRGSFFEEQKNILRFIRDNKIINNDGTPLSKAQIKNLIQIQASHLERVPGQPKDWTNLSKIAPDLGTANAYISSTIEKNLGKELLRLDDKTLKSHGIDRKELQNLVNGNHPSTLKAAQTYKAIAQYDLANPSKRSRYTAQVAIKAITDRINAGFYSKTLPTYQQLINDQVISTRSNKSQVIDGSSGTRKPPKAQVVGGSVSDNRNIGGTAARKGETFLNTDSTQAIKKGKAVTVPGIGRMGRFGPMRLPGAEDGFPRGQFTDGTERVYQTESGQYRDRATKKRLAEQEAKRLMRQDKQNAARRAKAAQAAETKARRSAGIGNDYKMSQKEWDANSKETQSKLRAQRNQNAKLDKQKALDLKEQQSKHQKELAKQKQELAQKEEKRQARQAKMKGMGGRVAGGVGAAAMIGVIGASMMGGSIGETAGQLMMPVMMLSMMLPMLTNKFGIALIAVGALVGGLVYFTQKLKDATKSGLNAGKSMSMTNEKLKEMSEFSGRVTASQIAERKREKQLTGEGAKKRRFGQNYMESEAGKSLLSDAEGMISSGMNSEQIASNFATQLSYAILQGAVTEDQARSIALGLSEKLGNYSIAVNISGQITELFGRNGEKLLSGDPLQISLAIQEKSVGQQAVAFENAMKIANENAMDDFVNNSKATTAAAAVFATGLTATLAAAPTGVGAVVAGLGTLAATAGTYVAAGGFKEISDQAENNKARGVAVQLGAEQLAQNQGLVDSLERQYDSQIAQLEAEKKAAKDKEQRLAIEQKINDKIAERDAGIKSQKEANAEIFNSLIQQAEILGSGFTDSIGLAIDERFKDASGAYKAAAELAKTALSELPTTKDGEFNTFKATLQVALASGEFDPVTVTNLINANKESGGEIETKFNLVVDAVGTSDANQLIQLMNAANIGDNRYTAIFDFIMNDQADFDYNLEALSEIASLSGDYGINFSIDYPGGEANIDRVGNFLKETKEMADKPVTLEILRSMRDETTGATQEAIKNMIANFDVLSAGKNKIPYEVIVDFVVGKSDPTAISAWYFSEGPGKNIPLNLRFQVEYETMGAAYFGAGIDDDKKTDGPTPTGGTTGGATESPYKSLLEDLKNLRKASINAAGGLEEIMKVLGGKKDLTQFKGVLNALTNLNTTPEFQDFVLGLDPKEQQKLFSITKGVANLTKEGKALQKVFNEISLGRFYLEQKQIIQESKNQYNAARKLVAAGLSYKDAWEAVADPIFAAAIAAAKNKKEVNKIIKAWKQAKAAVETYKSDLEKAEDIASKMSEYFSRKSTVFQARFVIDTASSQRAIMDAENEIEGLNFKLDDFNAGIQEIEWQEAEVNKKYEERFKALDKIEQINENISSQAKSQLDIADALTKGDVAAAARAVQAYREKQASESVDKQRQSLQLAQQAELDALVSSGGLTRKQLEEQILIIQKQIFNIEEKRLEPAQRLVELRQNELDLQLFNLDQQQAKWDIIYTSILDTLDPLGTYVELLEKANKLLNNAGGFGEDTGKKKFKGTRPGPDHDGNYPGEIWVGPKATWKWNAKTKTWKKISDVGRNDKKAKAGTENDNEEDENIPKLTKKQIAEQVAALETKISRANSRLGAIKAAVTGLTNERTRLQGLVNNAPTRAKIADINTKISNYTFERLSLDNQVIGFEREIKELQKLKTGGSVKGPGTSTSDSIPALLSNGEYVIKAASVDKFGKSFLDSINSGELPGYRLGGLIAPDKGGTVKPINKQSLISGDKKNVSKIINDKKQKAILNDKKSVNKAMLSQLAAKQNIAKKGKVFAEISKLFFDWTNPETMALSALPFGIGKAVRAVGDAVAPVAKKLSSFIDFKRNPKEKVLSDPQDIAVMDGYVRNAANTLLPTNTYNRRIIDNIIKTNNLGIAKGTPLVRVANEADAPILKLIKPGQSVILDRFMSATSASSKEFIEGMAKGTVQTGGRTGGPGKALYPLYKFNIKSDIPGIQDINKIIPESASNVVDSLIARGQSMKLRKITTDKKTGQQTYHFDLGKGIKAKTGFEQLGYQNYKKEMLEGLIREGRRDLFNPTTPGLGGFGDMSEWMPRYFANGGMVKKYAKGGDVVPSMLTPGEFVMSKYAVESFGAGNLKAINRGENIGDSVYNYNVNVNVATDSDPSQIANTVIREIKRIDSQKLRGNRF
jgi:TP901 family phage tail tape measure protein